MNPEVLHWTVFSILILLMFAIDIGMHRNDHEIKMKEAVTWSAIWIGVAMAFNLGIYLYDGLYLEQGSQLALEFFTAYVIEKSLSVDNLFVFILIFGYFKVPAKYQHKVLFWGIIGAIVSRAIFIFAGVALLERFHWIMYIFGAFLVWTGVKMALPSDGEVHPENNFFIRMLRKVLPFSSSYEHGHFTTVENGKRMISKLGLVLLIIETTDIIFALDSIPAVLAISKDAFIIFSSNIFAILGLRSLFFALHGFMNRFHLLKFALALILSFVGVKMLLQVHFDFKVPIHYSLLFILLTLTLAVIGSIRFPAREIPPHPGQVDIPGHGHGHQHGGSDKPGAAIAKAQPSAAGKKTAGKSPAKAAGAPSNRRKSRRK